MSDLNIYDIWSVREQGDERALVVCRPEHWGRPEGDFVKWLGASTAPCYVVDAGCRNGQLVALEDSRPDGFQNFDVVQRELKKTYPDAHPLGRGTIARAVQDRMGVRVSSLADIDSYWGKRTIGAIVSELKKRRGDFMGKNSYEREFQIALWELFRI